MSAGTTPESGPGSKRRRLIFFSLSAAFLILALLLFRDILLPFLLAIVIAYVLDPIANRMQLVMPRWVAVAVIMGTLLGSIGAFAAVAVPRIAVEVQRLTNEAPAMVRRARTEWLPALERELRGRMQEYAEETASSAEGELVGAESNAGTSSMDAGVGQGSDAILIEARPNGGYAVHLPPKGIDVHRNGNSYIVGAEPVHEERAEDFTTSLTQALSRQVAASEGSAVAFLQTVNTVAKALARGVFGFFLMLMIAAYLMITKDGILNFAREMVQPGKRMRFDELVERIDRGLSGVVRGQLMIAVVNGVLTGVGYYVLDLPYWQILTLIALVFSIIPIFGVIISSVPAIILAVQDSFMTAALVLGWIIIIHQLEANIFNPKIMGDAAKVHPVLVIFALLGGEHLFGLAGALLAVPVLSIAQSLFLHFREAALGVPSPTSSAGTVRAADG